jgi:hypothetical protein
MQYTCPTHYKMASEPEFHIQQNLEESRGVLLRIYSKGGFCIAVYNFGAVALPLEMEERLRELIGKKIAIIRFDGQFRVREV